MRTTKKIILTSALAVLTAPYAFSLDLPALYKEAAAPWSIEQAVKLPAALTPETLKAISGNYGAPAAARLVDKKDRVSALVKRFGTCDLNGTDRVTAEKHLNKEFKAEVLYFADHGCKAVKEALAGAGKGGSARSASLESLEGISGSLATAEGAAEFFDGSNNSGRAAEAVRSVVSGRKAGAAPSAGADKLRLPYRMPYLSDRAEDSNNVPPMPDIKETGRVHQAIAYWDEMAKRNWERRENSKGAEKAKAAAKAAVAFGFSALLLLSNLPQVEKAGARLRWDIKNGARGRTIAADSVKLAFHSGVVLLAFLPIPLTAVGKAALAGSPWAIAMLVAMTTGPINHYLVEFAD